MPTMVEVPKKELASRQNVKEGKVSNLSSLDEGLVNCLRNERVIVRFVPKPSERI